MKINNIFETHDVVEIVALLLADGERVKVIIDDGTATVAQGEYTSLLDSHLPDVIDGNSEVLLYVPNDRKTIEYLDDDYNKQKVFVSDQVLYAFRLTDGKMTVKAYGGRDLLRLLASDM